MRGRTPTLHCDAEDGLCGTWDVDFYETGATSVNGIRVTEDARAPGWCNSADKDLCPEHATEKAEAEPQTSYPAGHGFTPGQFGGGCRVMLARYPCPRTQEEHDPALPPEDIDVFGYRRDRFHQEPVSGRSGKEVEGRG